MGADCLKDDYMSKLCLSNNAMSFLIKEVKLFSKNITFMDGGGYNPWVTLRAWIYNLATLANEHTLNEEAKFFLRNIKWKSLPSINWVVTIRDYPNIFEENL